MQFDANDVMAIEVPRDAPLPMSDHHPLVAGRLSDGRQSYAFILHAEGGLTYDGSGPSPEEARFLRKNLDGNLILASPSPSDEFFVWVLRYDPDAYMHNKYYADMARAENSGMDSTGPFSWKFQRYLSETDVDWEDVSDGEYLPDVAEDSEMSTSECEDESESSENASICTEDDDQRTTGEGSNVSKDMDPSFS